MQLCKLGVQAQVEASYNVFEEVISGHSFLFSVKLWILIFINDSQTVIMEAMKLCPGRCLYFFGKNISWEQG
jgi:hypothetical protein